MTSPLRTHHRRHIVGCRLRFKSSDSEDERAKKKKKKAKKAEKERKKERKRQEERDRKRRDRERREEEERRREDQRSREISGAAYAHQTGNYSGGQYNYQKGVAGGGGGGFGGGGGMGSGKFQGFGSDPSYDPNNPDGDAGGDRSAAVSGLIPSEASSPPPLPLTPRHPNPNQRS